MPISIQQDIGPILDRKLPAFLDSIDERHVDAVRNLVHDFRASFGSRVLQDLQEGTFCKVLDTWISARGLDPELEEVIRQQRLGIFRELVHTKRHEFVLPPSDDVSRSVRGSSRRERRNGTSTPKKSNEEIRKIVDQYAQLAVYLGDNAALDILVMLGILRADERNSAFSALSEYLGECAPATGDGTIISILQSEDVILESMTVKEKMERSLVEFCYQRLMDEGSADTMEGQPWYLENIGSWVERQMGSLYEQAFGGTWKQLLKEKSASGDSPQMDLYDGVVNHFKAAASLKIPKHMAQTTTDHNGKEWPLGSWRQRLALVDMLNPRKRHMYLGFGAGEGKTFTHQWGYELAKQEHIQQKRPGRPRMLFIAPKAVLNEIPNRVRRGSAPKESHSLYYPDPEKAPTVGVIKAGMSLDEIRDHASREIVYCAYSMWNMIRRGVDENDEPIDVAIADILIGQDPPFTSFSVDESHLLQGGKKYTHLARRTIAEVPGLYDQGHILFSSATPAPGHIAGLRTTMELLEPPRPNIQEGERTNSPPHSWGELRSMIGNRLWMMDRPEDWMRKVERLPYALSAQEMACLQLIIDDNTLPANQKSHLSQLIIRCPRLMSGDPSMQWTSLNETTKHLSSLLHGDHRSTVLVAENILSHSVLQPAKNQDEDDLNNPNEYFYKALEQWCLAQGIGFDVIHGNVTDEDERMKIFEKMQTAKAEGRKHVLYAHSSCLNLGIDLRFIEGVISQEWPHNTPDLYQLLKRIDRMNNTNFRFIVSWAQRSIHEGIMTSAQSKHTDVLRLQHGTILSDHRMSELEEQTGVDTRTESVARKIESSEEKWERFSRTLHGVGAAKVRDFWTSYSDDFVELLDQKDKLSIGDGDRVTAALILDLEQSGFLPENGQYVHTCSGGQRLTQLLHRSTPGTYRAIRSMDATKDMLDFGGTGLPPHINQKGNIAETPDALNRLVREGTISAGSQDMVVLQGLEQTSHSVRQDGELEYTARVRAILGAVRALKTHDLTADPPQSGGILMIPMERYACSEAQLRQLGTMLMHFGLEIIPSHTGMAVSKDNEGEPPFEMHILTLRKVFEPSPQDIESVPADGFVLKPIKEREVKNKKKVRKLQFSLPHEQFKIGRRTLSTMPTIGRDDKIEQLNRLTEVVGFIQSLAPTSDAMIDQLKKKTVQSKLAQQGVVCFPHFGGDPKKKKAKKGQEKSNEPILERRLAFHFTDSPHLFYPYDSQWQKLSQE